MQELVSTDNFNERLMSFDLKREFIPTDINNTTDYLRFSQIESLEG